jgi:hypothetical protein
LSDCEPLSIQPERTSTRSQLQQQPQPKHQRHCIVSFASAGTLLKITLLMTRPPRQKQKLPLAHCSVPLVLRQQKTRRRTMPRQKRQRRQQRTRYQRQWPKLRQLDRGRYRIEQRIQDRQSGFQLCRQIEGLQAGPSWTHLDKTHTLQLASRHDLMKPCTSGWAHRQAIEPSGQSDCSSAWSSHFVGLPTPRAAFGSPKQIARSTKGLIRLTV